MPKFVKIGQSVAKILTFFDFSRWRPPSWIVEFTKFYWNRKFLFADGIWRAQTHHCSKFCQNRSFRYGDIAIFRIFKMATTAILNFRNCEILLVTVFQMVETHQHTKFCQNRSIGCKDIKIFRFLPRDAMLSAVYAVVVCLSVCVCVCVCVCHTPILYQNG